MKTAVLSLMMLAAASAFANEAADDRANRQTFQSATTRAAVQAEYLTARSQGTLPDTSDAASLRTQRPTVSKSRTQVRQEARQAAREHVIHELI